MTIGQMMLGEFDQEMQNTRKVLERCPDEKWNWKPHEKSGTLGWLAGHVGTVPEWITMTINTQELDYAPVGGPVFEPPKITNRKELLAASCPASHVFAACASITFSIIGASSRCTSDWSAFLCRVSTVRARMKASRALPKLLLIEL